MKNEVTLMMASMLGGFLLMGQATCSTDDADGDDWTVDQGDCDDTNAAVYPGALELCDGVDNNCDAVVDEVTSLSDDFEDGQLDGCKWKVSTHGTGVSSWEEAGAYTVDFQADASGDMFGDGIVSNCTLLGEVLDVEARYELLQWPSTSGVRVGISMTDLGAVERVGQGQAECAVTGCEVYLTHFTDGVDGITATSDLTGTLRMHVEAGVLSGYALAPDGSWTLIHSVSGVDSTVPRSIQLAAWSHDTQFVDQEVKVAYHDVKVSAGTIQCP